MKVRLFTILAIAALLFGVLGATTPVAAQAYGTSFITSITYQNIGAASTSINFTFYASDGTAIPISRPDLAPMAASSLYVGDLTDIGTGFKGSGILTSLEPIAATLVQVPQGGLIKNRPLSNGFSEGAEFILIPTVLKKTFNTNSIFTVQNVGGAAVDVTVTFIPADVTTPIVYIIVYLPVGSAKYFDMGTDVIAGIGDTFNGSVQLEAEAGGLLVASAIELSTTGSNTYAFESLAEGASTIFMPSALCKFNSVMDASFAIQNSGSVDVNISITLTSSTLPVVTKTYDLGSLTPGSKTSFNNCGPVSDPMPNGFIGSAVITATSTTGTPEIVAVGKIFGGGLSTAYVGVSNGADKLAIPYVRWTTTHWNDGTRQRAFIAIQNVGSDIVGDVVVDYIGRDGTVLCSQTLSYTAGDPLSSGEKVSVNAGQTGNPACEEFGYYADGFGGGAIITAPAGSQLAAITRIQTVFPANTSNYVAEDFNAIAVP